MEERTLELIKNEIYKHFDKVLLDPQKTRAAEKDFKNGSLIADLQGTLKAGASIGVWREVENVLRNRPEPTPEGLEELLKSIPELTYILRDRFIAMRKVLPHRPGGVRSKLTEAQKKKAVQLVGNLMGCGDSYAEAIANVATRFRVSKKTIQRLWQGRGRGKAK